MINIQGEVHLKKGKEYSLKRFHPWIFSGAIHLINNNPTDGMWVKVIGHEGETLGYGHYQKGSISIRMLSFGEAAPEENFWTQRLEVAWTQRRHLGLLSQTTNAFRLVHGEGDGLPGLIVDYYNGVAVMQAHSAGMHLDRQTISLALQEVFKEDLKAVYYQNQGTPASGPKDDVRGEYLFQKGGTPLIIQEHGHKFYVDWETGQKTGFFLDQRENRYELSKLSKGRTVLNTFCYSGGFTVYALAGGAALVHSVDSSARAIDLTEKNIALNGFDAVNHSCYTMDTFQFLKDSQNKYDLIILDPPAFAKHRDARHQAVKGYQRLNAEAMRVIKPGGLIFTFSCSQVVDRQLFYDTIVSAAIQSGRQVKVLQHLGQPADHPVSLYHPEGEYLKGLVLYVT